MPLINHYSRPKASLTVCEDEETRSFNKSVGTLLKKARKQSNFSQEYVGDILGISQDTISKHEKGTPVTAYRLKEFSKLYRKPITFFYMADTETR
jgi:transcriptional regulator with XRE-family HTH domain